MLTSLTAHATSPQAMETQIPDPPLPIYWDGIWHAFLLAATRVSLVNRIQALSGSTSTLSC